MSYLNSGNKQKEKIGIFGKLFIQELWQKAKCCIFCSKHTIMKKLLLVI